MHAIEKILAKNSGKASVKTGEIVTAKVDFAEVNDLYLQTIYSFKEMQGQKVWDKDRLAFVFDHYAPAPTIKSAQIHKEMREFVKEHNLTYHFDINAGVCHQVMPERGVIYPGAIVVATDSHTTTHGAFGAMGTGVGATDMATIIISGELWFRVPEIIEIRIDGIPKKGVMPKDVVLHVLGKMKADGAVYKAIDFTGSYIEQLNVAGRMVICNMAVEMGAKTAYMQPNEDVLAYIKERAVREYEVHHTDDDFEYSESYQFNVADLSPQIAAPHSVDNVQPIETFGSIKVDQCFVGTCTGGRLEDIEITANILKGKKIAEDVRLIVIPASKEVLQKCIEKGYLQDCIEAGATISTPGCGPCLSAHEGVLAPGEVCITASNRNFPGRMGSNQAEIYLASPATVAASALKGYLTDPKNIDIGGINMKTKLKGKVIVLGNNIDTDQIYPGRFLELVKPEEVGAHCLAGVDETIAPQFIKGDIVVAGTNFGCGSSREHAPISLLNMGASAVLADSFARIFFRNSINLGLPLIVCKGISQKLEKGEEIEVDIVEGTITILRTGEVLQGDKIGEYAMSILEAGGIKPMFIEKMKVTK